MNVKVSPALLHGTVRAISSKSYMHRTLICASLADEPTVLHCTDSNRDIQATANCLRALGAEIAERDGVYTVVPIRKRTKENVQLFCDESGSTLRFLLPIAASLGIDAAFHARGRLSLRPLSPLYEELRRNGAVLSPNGVFPLSVSGQLQGGEYILDGGISSQFFTGLLMALPLLDTDSTIKIIGALESAPYVRLTESVMNRFGVFPTMTEQSMTIAPSAYHTPKMLFVEGDWSNAAFWLVAGAIGGDICITGLDMNSAQGDKEIVPLLKQMGADITVCNDSITVRKSTLTGIDIHAINIPDLVPILSVAAACAQGETVIYGASRLRLKESDRIASVSGMLTTLGIDCAETDDGLIIRGGTICGGHVDACNDHRIAMSAAIAALASKTDIIIKDAHAVDKSYPAFFTDFCSLGGIAVTA